MDNSNNHFADKDSVKARQELEEFEDALQDVQNQTVKSRNEKGNENFITQDVYQILSEDVGLLSQQV